jgi:PKD repeat protein
MVSNSIDTDTEIKTDYITVTENAGSNPEYPWADWPLDVVGYSTVEISKAEFEALAAAPDNDSQIWVDDEGNSFKGVSLWRLIAEVDGGDSSTLNDDLIGTYSIKLTGQNPDQSTYTVIIAPPYLGFDFFSVNQDIIIANKRMEAGTTEWVDLPFDYM